MKEVDGLPAITSNHISIMLELARSVYLEEVLFGKKDSKERSEVESFIELANRMNIEELVEHLNKHLEMRMFLVG